MSIKDNIKNELKKKVLERYDEVNNEYLEFEYNWMMGNELIKDRYELGCMITMANEKKFLKELIKFIETL